jgi:hypothetical protein
MFGNNKNFIIFTTIMWTMNVTYNINTNYIYKPGTMDNIIVVWPS